MSAREHLTTLLDGIDPWDEWEAADLATTRAWIASGAPLYRTRKPDIPPAHLVSYFVVLDEVAGRLLLVAHRNAGLWLPPGGHVEPDESPWAAVVRECQEELQIPAVPSTVSGDRPFFLTVTATRGPGGHTDVSLWHVIRASTGEVVRYDTGEFADIRWLTPQEVLAEPADRLDPEMHRFAHKLLDRSGTSDPAR